jgi:hypothetical protein
MTSRRLGLAVLSLWALVAAGCGNYSNEDLEFMNALPESDELRVKIPPVTSAVQLANEAELAKSTHDTTRGLNGLLMGLVGIVDAVRSYPPTARTATSRIWGPFPTDRAKLKNLDWETRMIVSRDDADPTQFDYEIAVHHVGAADTDWPVLLRGWFQVGMTARRGKGHVELVTASARAEFFDTSDLGMLDHLEIDYDTVSDPVMVTMHITDLPAAGSTDPAPTAAFTYLQNAVGQGQMTFDLVGNFILLTPAVEDMRITSQWLATGEGRADLMVVSGDGAGARQVECWDRSFQATYNDKPWAPGEDVPGNPPGDPASVCPVITPLSQP